MAEPSALTPHDILVWDAPVRVFHGCLALSFAGAWLSAEAEGWRLLHVTLGWTVAGLVLLRLLWGLVGTRYARFAQFVRRPLDVMAYARLMLAGRAGAGIATELGTDDVGVDINEEDHRHAE